MKRIIITIAFLAFISLGYCQSTKDKMDDALGRAYKAATEKRMDEAKDWFHKAMQYAKELNSWQGLIDSGYGLSTLGLTEEAKASFDSASSALGGQKPDWHAAVAIGYAYASLPRELGTVELATQMWTRAKEWADNEKDPYGLLEVGRGFMSLLKNKEAEECLDLAKNIVKESPGENAIKALVQAYRKLGKEDKALECTKYQTESKSPPPGWTPTVGEGIRSPKTVPASVQQAQRESTDKDIERKQAWEQEQERLKEAENVRRETMAYQMYRDYLYYYSYPYYGVYTGVITNFNDYYIYAWTTQPVWAIRTYDEVYNWALWNLGRYTCVNGVYIAVDID